MYSLFALLRPASLRLRAVLLDWPLMTAALVGLALGLISARQTGSNIATDLIGAEQTETGSL